MSAQPVSQGFQDKAPPGGYPKLEFKRGIGKRGPPGWAIFGGIFAASAYGFYQVWPLAFLLFPSWYLHQQFFSCMKHIWFDSEP
jgi:hypothetical protein